MVTSTLQIRPPLAPQKEFAQVADFLRASGASVNIQGDATAVLTGVALDSRLVMPGDLWIAVQGLTHHGAQHWQQAVERGCAGVVADEIGAELLSHMNVDIPVIAVVGATTWVGPLSAWFYDRPGESLYTVGVTGTNGKTSMTHFLVATWSALSAAPAACIGTLGVRVYSGAAVENTATGFTTPEAPVLHACLETLRQRKVANVALEISSHALTLGRVDGFCVDLAIFTNLSHDHLDFHADMQDYFEAKTILFTQSHSRQALVCVDEPWGQRLAQSLREQGRSVVTYGATQGDYRMTGFGAGTCTVEHGGMSTTFAFNSPGEFNAVNATGTFAVLILQGVPRESVIAAMSAVSQVPGRMEVVSTAGQPLTVIDYAHSPDSVERVLEALRTQTQGTLIAVLGAGGDRDVLKRPHMGMAALKAGVDVIVITDDNPRSEDPAVIRAAVRADIDSLIAAGVTPVEVHEIGDRSEAVAFAIALAAPDDTVAVLGKGAETGQHIGDVVLPFDDRDVARACLTTWIEPGRAR